MFSGGSNIDEKTVRKKNESAKRPKTKKPGDKPLAK